MALPVQPHWNALEYRYCTLDGPATGPQGAQPPAAQPRCLSLSPSTAERQILKHEQHEGETPRCTKTMQKQKR